MAFHGKPWLRHPGPGHSIPSHTLTEPSGAITCHPMPTASLKVMCDYLLVSAHGARSTQQETKTMARKIKTLAATEIAIEDTAALEAVVSHLEATEVQASAAETEIVLEAPAARIALVEAFEKVEDGSIAKMMAQTKTAIDDRQSFEDLKDPDNANIHRTLKKVRGSLERAFAAKVMVAANQDPNFINRVLMDGSCYNVYAIGKYADLVDALAGTGMRNAINIAVTRSLFAFAKAGLEFNGEMAKAAASDKIRVSAEVQRHLIRHTVSASTAPTQASSTMQALQTLGIVAIDGSRKNPKYKLLDNAVTDRLREVVEAMAA